MLVMNLDFLFHMYFIVCYPSYMDYDVALHCTQVQEEIRNTISALETDLMNESEKSSSAHAKVEKYREARREVERKFDVQYQRRV